MAVAAENTVENVFASNNSPNLSMTVPLDAMTLPIDAIALVRDRRVYAQSIRIFF